MTEIPEIKKINWKGSTSSEKLALDLIRLLKKAGFEKTYIVGGYVRDLLLRRKETGAIDLATAAKPDQVIRLLRNKFRVIPTGLKHGTVTVHQGQDDIEITTFRKEGKYLDYRRPVSVKFISDPAADSARRDLSVNALYFDPVKKEVLDFQKGIIDLKNKVLRFVGSAEDRIIEDPLRLMRVIRFATVLGFKMKPAETSIIKKRASLIRKISFERVKVEMDKIVRSGRRADGLRLLQTTGILKQILSEIDQLVKTRQSNNYHSEGSVFEHTLLGLSIIETSADLPTLYGLLFHDAGKAQTAVPARKHGRAHMTFYGHQQVGEDLVKKALKRLRFSSTEILDIAWYVRNHHVPYELRKMRKSKQVAWCLDPRFENLLKIYRADTLSSIPTDSRGRRIKQSLETYNYSLKAWKSAKSQKSFQQKLVSGRDVMKILEIPEGREVGNVLKQVRELQLAGKIKNKKQALEYLKNI